MSNAQIAKIFSDRFNIKFIRSPQSGAFHTNNPITITENLAGDIVSDDANFRFSVEIKARKDISFFKVLNGFFDEFILQCETDATSVNKLPLIIVKINNYAPFCLLKDIESNLKYKDYSIVYLEELLKQKEEFFFDKNN